MPINPKQNIFWFQVSFNDLILIFLLNKKNNACKEFIFNANIQELIQFQQHKI